MNEQKVLEKARIYCLAYQSYCSSYYDNENEKRAKAAVNLLLAKIELLEAVTEGPREEPPPMKYPKYEAGEPVIYVNGTKIELGIVKRDCGDDNYFIYYHTGDTAARTHARHLVKVSNRHAYHIVRLDPDGNERKKL